MFAGLADVSMDSAAIEAEGKSSQLILVIEAELQDVLVTLVT